MEQKVKVYSRVIKLGSLDVEPIVKKDEVIKQISSSCCINKEDNLVVTLTFLIEKEE